MKHRVRSFRGGICSRNTEAIVGGIARQANPPGDADASNILRRTYAEDCHDVRTPNLTFRTSSALSAFQESSLTSCIIVVGGQRSLPRSETLSRGSHTRNFILLRLWCRSCTEASTVTTVRTLVPFLQHQALLSRFLH